MLVYQRVIFKIPQNKQDIHRPPMVSKTETRLLFEDDFTSSSVTLR